MKVKKSKWSKKMMDSVKDTPEFKRETKKLEKEWNKDKERGIIKKKVSQLIRKYKNSRWPWRPEYALGELYSWLIDRDKKEEGK